MKSQSSHDSDRYRAQAEVVMRLAARAGSRPEKEVYRSIAEGWRRLAVEAVRHEMRQTRDRQTPQDEASPSH